jgi:hypothetical protein
MVDNLPVPLDGSRPVRLMDGDIDTLATASQLPTRLLASGVTNFTVTQSGPAPGVTAAIKFTLSLARQGNTGQTTADTFTLSRSMSFRNRY